MWFWNFGWLGQRVSVFCGASRRCARPLSAHKKNHINIHACSVNDCCRDKLFKSSSSCSFDTLCLISQFMRQLDHHPRHRRCCHHAQLENSVVQASLCDLCCSSSQHVMELCIRLSQEAQPLHASKHVSSGGFESRLSVDRCHVAVGLIVPCVLCLCRQLGVVAHWHSQTVQHTLDTTNVVLDLRVIVLAQLDNLLDGPGL